MTPRETEPEVLSKSESSWRAKYQTAHEAAGGGREQAVTEIAGAWILILKAMAAECELAGVRPLVDPDSLAASIVLTVDGLLPANVKLTAEMKAAGGSTVILGQRFFYRKKIAAAIKVAKEREESKSTIDKMRDRAARDSAEVDRQAAAELERREQAARATKVAPTEAAPPPSIEHEDLIEPRNHAPQFADPNANWKPGDPYQAGGYL